MFGELIMAEWNYGNWAMFSIYNRNQAKESYNKGYRYCEIHKNTEDVTYLKYKPKTLFRDTKVLVIDSYGNLK